MAILTGQITLLCDDLTEYESLRAAAVADPDINLVTDNRPELKLTVYFDAREA